jgi:hypothetical protein
VSTSYSVSEFKVIAAGVLDGKWTGSASASELAKAHDGINVKDIQGFAAGECDIQLAFRAGYVGVLEGAQFFINNLVDKSPYTDGNLVLEGSDDGSTWTALWTVDATIHEGWNSYDFSESDPQPSYNMYRLHGSMTGSCRVGEVQLTGVETIDDDASTHTCTPKIVLAGEEQITSLNPVTYAGASTPVLKEMSTRFASVLGGEEVTFSLDPASGSGGIAGGEAATVRIDNRDCAVSNTAPTAVTCTTDHKPYVADTPVTEINIAGYGNVAMQGKYVWYVSRYSEDQTWGYNIQPIAGDAIEIPRGMHLLVDVPRTPELSFITVEGSLIFEPDSDPA